MSGVLKTICRKWSVFRENSVFWGFRGLRGGFGFLGGVSMKVFVANFPRNPLVVVLKRCDGFLGREIEIPKFRGVGFSRENGYFRGRNKLSIFSGLETIFLT